MAGENNKNAIWALLLSLSHQSRAIMRLRDKATEPRSSFSPIRSKAT